MNRKVVQINFRTLKRCRRIAAVLLCACGCAGCGLKWNMFVTPVYRIPPGYSDSYRRSLEVESVPLNGGPASQMPAGSMHGPYFGPEGQMVPMPSKSMLKPDSEVGRTDRGANRSVDLMPSNKSAKLKSSGSK